MGIGRRQFLKLTSLALVGISIDPFQSVITTEDIYINKKLGILFHKPKTWGFVKITDFGRLKANQILHDGWEELKDLVHEELGEPICIATKYHQDLPENQGVFSPTITLNITPKEELEDLGHANFEELLALSRDGVSQILKDFKVLKEYEPYYLSGCKFYEYDAQYYFEHVDLEKPLRVELKVLKTEHNGFYYDFNCHQSSEQNQVATREFLEFKKTIKLI